MQANTALLTALRDPVMVADSDAQILALNAPAVALFGRSADRLVGGSAIDLFVDEDREAARRELQGWRARETPWHRFEARVHGAQGVRLAELTCARSATQGGDVVVVVYRDLSPRVALEAAREAARQRLADLVDGLPGGVLAARAADGQFLFSNRVMQQMTGYSDAELARMAPLDMHPPQAADRVRADFARLARGDLRPSVELPVQRKDGSVFYADLHKVEANLGDERAIVAMFIDVTDRRETTRALRAQEARNRALLTRDPLTGLANRAHFLRTLAEVFERGPVTVLALDLDDFGSLSARLPTGQADRLLQAVAGALLAGQPEPACVARLSRDEFAACFANTTPHALRGAPVEALQRALAACAPEVGLTACVGLAGSPTDHHTSPTGLLREALRAMYAAKLRGADQTVVFEPQADQAQRARYARRDRIAQGLDAGEFILHYQPQVNLRTGQLKRLEALVRWAHPTQGLLPPSRFLPDLAGDPLLIRLGDVVLRAAVSQQAVWRQAGLDVAVSVNVDATQLADAGFPDRVEALLDEHPGLRPGSLCLEVLETSALEVTQQVADLMTRLMRRGVRFALDDFGTGYASLTFLKQLPAAVVKIDQSFVRGMLADLEQAVIVDSILGLARGLGRLVVAEGVEAVEHGVRLLALGCELGQGYAIARPMPADAVPGWAETWRPPVRWQAAGRLPREQIPAQLAIWHHEAWLADMQARVEGRLTSSPRSAEACPILPWLGRGPEGEARRRHHQRLHAQADALLAHAAAHGPEDPGTQARWQALCEANRAFVVGLDSIHTPPPQG